MQAGLILAKVPITKQAVVDDATACFVICVNLS
jgi:hypothetical protein